jgi:Protein of unknown function (DUF3768)
MHDESPNCVTRVQEINDAFRRSFIGGVVVVTAGFESLPAGRRGLILAKVRAFDQFNEDNDPHGEHDFGLRPLLLENRLLRPGHGTDVA